MPSAFLRKMEFVTDLSFGDREALRQICSDIRSLPAKKDIISQGDQAKQVYLVVEGWAERYELLDDGSRQITAFLLPGDLSDQHVTALGKMDHNIRTITSCRVAYISNRELDVLATERPEIARALQWSTLVDQAVLREWIVNNGRRNAYQRLAHLLCELHARLSRVGLANELDCNFPLTQIDLADALGLTSVHVNRMLQRLRNEGLIELNHQILLIPNLERLCEAGGFSSSYLHGPITLVPRPKANTGTNVVMLPNCLAR